jgi:hypothetical protein
LLCEEEKKRERKNQKFEKKLLLLSFFLLFFFKKILVPPFSLFLLLNAEFKRGLLIRIKEKTNVVKIATLQQST